MKSGTKRKARTIDLEAVKEACKNSLQNTDVAEVFNALPDLHAFAGCDTVSAFAGKWRVKALKLVKKNNEFLRLFQVTGNEWTLPEDVYSQAERFICHFYGHGEENDVNLLRYKIDCARRGKIEGEQLPPCRSSLRNHVDRANYQSRIWKLSLQSVIEAPSPTLHGWKQAEDDDEELLIDWMDCLPAPEEVSFSKISVTKAN